MRVQIAVAMAFVFAFSASAGAAEEKRLWRESPCGAKIDRLLSEWSVYQRPTQIFQADGLGSSQHVFSARAGFFLTVTRDPGKTIQLVKFSPESRLDLEWTEPDCGAHARVAVAPARDKSNFTDLDLHQLVTTAQQGLIYVYSPEMPLSLKAISEIKKAASETGLTVTFLSDPNLPAMKPETGCGECKTMKSKELQARGVLNHFPSVLYFSNGALMDTIVPGYMTSEGYVRQIKSLAAKEVK